LATILLLYNKNTIPYILFLKERENNIGVEKGEKKNGKRKCKG
jgi:hypothetical protein